MVWLQGSLEHAKLSIKKLQKLFGIIPRIRKKHRKNIPAFGGIAIFFSIVLSMLIIDVSIPYNDILGIFFAKASTCGNGTFKTRPISRIEDFAAIFPYVII